MKHAGPAADDALALPGWGDLHAFAAEQKAAEKFRTRIGAQRRSRRFSWPPSPNDRYGHGGSVREGRDGVAGRVVGGTDHRGLGTRENNSRESKELDRLDSIGRYFGGVDRLSFGRCPVFGHGGSTARVVATANTPMVLCWCRGMRHTSLAAVEFGRVHRCRRPDLMPHETVMWNQRVLAAAEGLPPEPAVLTGEPEHVRRYWRGLVLQQEAHRRLGLPGAVPHSKRWAMRWDGLSDHYARLGLARLRDLGLVTDGPPPPHWDAERPTFHATAFLVAEGYEQPAGPPPDPVRRRRGDWREWTASPAQVAYAAVLAQRLGRPLCRERTRGVIGPLIARWRAELRGRPPGRPRSTERRQR